MFCYHTLGLCLGFNFTHSLVNLLYVAGGLIALTYLVGKITILCRLPSYILIHKCTCLLVNGNATLQVDQENIAFEDPCHFSTLCKKYFVEACGCNAQKYFVQVNSKTYYEFDRNGKQ